MLRFKWGTMSSLLRSSRNSLETIRSSTATLRPTLRCLPLGEDLCLPTTIKQSLNGTIILYESLGRLRETSIGCSIESKYENAMSMGALAWCLSLRTPSLVKVITCIGRAALQPFQISLLLYELNSSGARVNYGRVPLLEIGSAFAREYPTSLTPGEEHRQVTMKILGCFDHNPYVFWLNEATIPVMAVEVPLCGIWGVQDH